MANISLAETDLQIARCFPVMVQLRPHLREDAFIAQVRRQSALNHYTLAFLEENGTIESVAGFRISESLYYGRFLYVDDLITSQAARSRGFGGTLLGWLVEHAKQNGCDAVALDSGVQRFDAHRFYLSKRMNIVCHHFALKLK